jgi:hypothetical protein
MATISIPGDELAEAVNMLKDIRDRIDRTASLSSVGSDQDVGDSGLIDAVNDFDAAWKGGQERVQENADTFRKAVEGILRNFQDTDDQTVGQPDQHS